MTRTTKRLSAKKVETIRKAGYHADGEGLYLVVDKSGARRWAYIYHTHGKRREMGLGRMGLKEARERRQRKYVARSARASIRSRLADMTNSIRHPFRRFRPPRLR